MVLRRLIAAYFLGGTAGAAPALAALGLVASGCLLVHETNVSYRQQVPCETRGLRIHCYALPRTTVWPEGGFRALVQGPFQVFVRIEDLEGTAEAARILAAHVTASGGTQVVLTFEEGRGDHWKPFDSTCPGAANHVVFVQDTPYLEDAGDSEFTLNFAVPVAYGQSVRTHSVEVTLRRQTFSDIHVAMPT